MYKILSIDGGGIHGIGSLTILKRLLKECPDLIENTDMFAGTSIGGILSLGLAFGNEIDEIEKFFIEGIPYAFDTNIIRSIFFLLGFYPKYNNDEFKNYLTKLFGNAKLKHLHKKVLITSFCLDDEKKVNRRWKAKIFHNFEGSDSDASTKIVDVAMSTSSAPVFFKVYDKYIDGALVGNNPSLIALSQTQDKRNTMKIPSLDEVKILSIGSIRNIYVPTRNARWGYFHWARRLIQLITEKDSLVTSYQCDKMIGGNYRRIEMAIDVPMDDYKGVKEIKQVADSHNLEDDIEWLKKNWA